VRVADKLREVAARRPFQRLGCGVESSEPTRWRVSRLFSPFYPSFQQLGPLEQRLLEQVWSRGTTTVRELVETSDLDVAYTTVMTTLDRLYKKRLLTRESEGRAFRYAPRFTQQELQRAAAGQAIRELLDTSASRALPLSYLVEVVSEHDTQLLEELQQLVEQKRRQLQEQTGKQEKA
jgi:predicted transcriptional regulator